ncbi:MAG TPA: nucleotidyltransferase family protein [Longimicrobium sp.]|nr:nucleotidyltransferase family protein [Longimicrobium sp.]
MNVTLLPAAPPRTLAFHALDEPPAQVEARFRDAARAGRPRWFWPEVPVAAWRAALREVERTASRLLAGPSARAHLGGKGGPDATAFGLAGFTSGLGPLLGWWIEQEMLDAPPAAAAIFLLQLEHGRARHRRMAEELDGVLSVLHAAGVEAVVVKGMHTARDLFPDPGTRPMTDADVVVAQNRVPAAEAALRTAGFQRQPESLITRPYHADWTPPGPRRVLRSLWLTHAESPSLLNLHGSFDHPHPGGGVLRLGEPAPGERVEWDGAAAPARVLRGAYLAAYLAVHASRERVNLTLLRLAELALLFRGGGVDTGRLDALLERAGARAEAWPALSLAEALVPGTVDAGLLAVLERATPPRVRRAYAGVRPADLPRAHGARPGDYLLWTRGLGSLLRRAGPMLFPTTSPRVLASVYLRRVRHVARLLRGGNGE